MPKRFANGGNGRNLDDISKNQDRNTGAGKANYFSAVISNTNDIEKFKELCDNVTTIQDAIYFQKTLIKLNKENKYHELLKQSMISNGLAFSTKNLKNLEKLNKRKLHDVL